MRLPARLLFGCSLVLAAGCTAGGGAATDTKADEAAIREIDTNWNTWLTTQNDSAISAIYAADAVLMPPNMPRVMGDGVRKFWAELWPMKASLHLAPGTIVVSGDRAVEEGNWTFAVPTPAGEQKDNGKYLVIWRKTDGKWHAVQDIWNSDNPPPTAPAAPK